MKKCKYSKCYRLLLPNNTSIKGCCNELHAKLEKQEYNLLYYKKTKRNNQIVKHEEIFKICICQFGEGVEIDANFLELLGMDWNLETHKVTINNLEYIGICSYAYIILKTKKVKIIRI